MPKYFILNPQGHYLVVDGQVDPKKLTGCSMHSSLHELYRAAAQTLELSLPEVEGTEIYIGSLNTLQTEQGLLKFPKKTWIESDFRGDWTVIDLEDNQTIEHYISTWEC